mgnify:CR=1 FL=1
MTQFPPPHTLPHPFSLLVLYVVFLGADIITIHLEACADAHEVIRQIHSCGCKAGVSIKPGTPIEVLEEYLDEVELILIMSVEPGFGGQKYIPESTERIRQTAELIRKSGREIELEVDGGVAPDTCQTCIDAGANVLVAGSAVYKAEDIPARIKELRGKCAYESLE